MVIIVCSIWPSWTFVFTIGVRNWGVQKSCFGKRILGLILLNFFYQILNQNTQNHHLLHIYKISRPDILAQKLSFLISSLFVAVVTILRFKLGVISSRDCLNVIQSFILFRDRVAYTYVCFKVFLQKRITRSNSRRSGGYGFKRQILLIHFAEKVAFKTILSELCAGLHLAERLVLSLS